MLDALSKMQAGTFKPYNYANLENKQALTDAMKAWDYEAFGDKVQELGLSYIEQYSATVTPG